MCGSPHNVGPVPFDRDRAKKLLADAGYPGGFEVTLDCPNNRYVNDEKICQALAAMWTKIGVNTRLVTMPRAQYFPKLEKLDTSLYMLGWGGASTDAIFTLQPVLSTFSGKGDGDYNYGRYTDPEFDAIVGEVKVEMNTEKRLALIRRALEIQRAEMYHLSLHRQVIPWAGRSNVVIPHRADNQVWPVLWRLVVMHGMFFVIKMGLLKIYAQEVGLKFRELFFGIGIIKVTDELGSTDTYNLEIISDVLPIAWFKADSLATTYNDGDKVVHWVNEVGAGFDLRQVSSLAPVFKTNILNSKPVVRFPNGELLVSALNPPAENNVRTILAVVVNSDTWTLAGFNQYILGYGNNNITNNLYGLCWTALPLEMAVAWV